MRFIEPIFSLRVLFVILAASVALLVAGSGAFGQDDIDLDAFDGAAQEAPAEEGGQAPAGDAAAGGASDSSDSSSSEGKKDSYLVWMYRSLGWFFTIVFSLLSLTMVALIVINIVALQRSALAPEELAEDFGALLDQNKFQEAYELAKKLNRIGTFVGLVMSTLMFVAAPFIVRLYNMTPEGITDTTRILYVQAAFMTIELAGALIIVRRRSLPRNWDLRSRCPRLPRTIFLRIGLPALFSTSPS